MERWVLVRRLYSRREDVPNLETMLRSPVLSRCRRRLRGCRREPGACSPILGKVSLCGRTDGKECGGSPTDLQEEQCELLVSLLMINPDGICVTPQR